MQEYSIEDLIAYRKAVWKYRDAFKSNESTEASRIEMGSIYQELSTHGKRLADEFWEQVQKSWP